MLSSVQFSRNICSIFDVRLQTFDGLSKAVCLTSTVETNQQLPNLPGRFQPSTFGVCGLNYCVRYGNRWSPTAIVTGYFVFRNTYVITIHCVFQQVLCGNRDCFVVPSRNDDGFWLRLIPFPYPVIASDSVAISLFAFPQN